MMIINLFFLSIFLFSTITTIHALETTTIQNFRNSSLDSTLEPILPSTAEKLVRLRRQPPYAVIKHYIRAVKPSKQRRRIKRPKTKYGPPKYSYSPPITFYKQPMKSLSQHHYLKTFDDFQNLKFDTSDLHLPPSSYEAQAMNLDFYSDEGGKQTKAPRIEYSFTSEDESPSYSFSSHSNKDTSVTRAPHQRYGIPKDFEYASNFENVGSEQHISSPHASFESDKSFGGTEYSTGSEHSYAEPPENSFESAPSFEGSYHDQPSYDVPENPSSKYEVAHAPPIEPPPSPTIDHGKFQTYKKKSSINFQSGKQSFGEPPSPPKTDIEITYSPSYEINLPPSFSDNTYKEKPGHFAEPPAYTPPDKPSIYQPEQSPSYHSDHSLSDIPPSGPGHQPPSAPAYQPPSSPAYQPPSSPGHSPPTAPEHQPPSKPIHHRPSLPIHKPPSAPAYKPPSAPNYHRPSSIGHQPSSPGYQPPSGPGPHRPSAPSGPGHQPPSAPGHQPPSAPGHQLPSGPGHQPPSGPGHQPPSGSGHQPPSAPGHQPPSAPEHQPPSASGHFPKDHFSKHPSTGPPAHPNQQFTSGSSHLQSFFDGDDVPSSQELPLTPNHKQPPYDFPKSSYEVPIYDPVPFDASNREQEFYPPQPYDDDVSAENSNDNNEPHAHSESIKEKKVTRNSKNPLLDISDVDTRSSSTSKRPKYIRARKVTRGGGGGGSHSTIQPIKHILDAPELEMAFEAGKRKTLKRYNSDEPDTNESSKTHNFIPSTMETTLSTESYLSNPWNPMRIRTSTRIVMPVQQQQQSTASISSTRFTPSTVGYSTSNNRLRQRQRDQSRNREKSSYSPASVARTRDVDGSMKNIDILSIEKSQSHSYYDGTLPPATAQPIPTTFSYKKSMPTRFKMPPKLMSQSLPTKRTTKSVFDTTHFKSPIFKSSENDKNDISKLLGLGQNLPKNHKLY